MTPVEVKSSKVVRDEHFAGLRYFIKKFGIKKGVLIYMGEDQSRDQIELKSFIHLLVSQNNTKS